MLPVCDDFAAKCAALRRAAGLVRLLLRCDAVLGVVRGQTAITPLRVAGQPSATRFGDDGSSTALARAAIVQEDPEPEAGDAKASAGAGSVLARERLRRLQRSAGQAAGSARAAGPAGRTTISQTQVPGDMGLLALRAPLDSSAAFVL